MVALAPQLAVEAPVLSYQVRGQSGRIAVVGHHAHRVDGAGLASGGARRTAQREEAVEDGVEQVQMASVWVPETLSWLVRPLFGIR